MRKQRGNALLIFLALFMSVFAYFAVSSLTTQKNAMAGSTSKSLAMAKEALVGFAVTYGDSHSGQVAGYLPCPDTNNDGFAEATCGLAGVTVVGRLPWKTLGLPDLRDSTGECLWYVVSGVAKDSPKNSTAMNWDALGQIHVQDKSGSPAMPTTATHDTPWAVIVAPGVTLPGQDRTPPAGTTICGGNTTVTAYLEGAGQIGGVGLSPLRLSQNSGDTSNNDFGLTITGADIFNRVAARKDFGSAVVDTLLGNIADCLGSQSFASLPVPASANKGMGDTSSGLYGWLTTGTNCTQIKNNPVALRLLDNWQDNLVYAKPSGTVKINGAQSGGVLVFSGQRTSSGQNRTSVTEKNTLSRYLEGALSASACAAGATCSYDNTVYQPRTAVLVGEANSTLDVARAIGLPAGSEQLSLAANISQFSEVGAVGAVLRDASAGTVTLTTPSVGSGSGCVWHPDPLTIAGRNVRAYLEYQFLSEGEWNETTNYPAGTVVTRSSTKRIYRSLQGGNVGQLPEATGSVWWTSLGTPDRRNGFTFQLVRSDLGVTKTPGAVGACGTVTDMGALTISTPGSDPSSLGQKSLTFEFDINRDALKNDPVAPANNHVAILKYGNLTHSATNGELTAACNGTKEGCVFSTADYLENTPVPQVHNQRIEIASGCNASCSTCDASAHVSPNTYARIRAWVDCVDCRDMSSDVTSLQPTIYSCVDLGAAGFLGSLNQAYLGFTGGFPSGTTAKQGVTIRMFTIRSSSP